MTRNHDTYRNLPGEYSTDIVANAAVGFLDEAIAASDRPFFIGVAPIAPHSETVTNPRPAKFNPPVPAKRHEHLFQNVTVPRTPNFNPDKVCCLAIHVRSIISHPHSSQEQHPTSRVFANSTNPR
jgi:hypothetical protein